MNKVKKGVVSFSDQSWSAISDNAKDFIKKLLTFDIETRPNAEDAIKHPWII